VAVTTDPAQESGGAPAPVDYRFEVLRAPELGRLTPLFDDAFGDRDFSGELLQRKYGYGAAGIEAFVCAAFAPSGEPAGAVGVLPWAVRYGDRVEVAGQMVDVSTSNAHRGRGLFVRLAEMARETCEVAGVTFLYGFPNEAAYPIWLNKLGYEHSDDLVEYHLPVQTLPVERAALRIHMLAAPYKRYANRVLDKAAAPDGLPNSLIAEGFAGIERDDAFYDYKRTFAGSRVVRAEGGRAWVRLGGGIIVGDLEASTQEDADAMTHSLTRLARRLGAHQVVVIASKDTRLDRLLPPRFSVSPGLPIIYRNIRSEIPKEKLRYSFGDLDNF
jgi:hypothetical protein